MKNILKFIDDFFYIVGASLASYGVWLIYKPAGYITAGIFMVIYAILIASKK
ncbi:MAG: hypothetical protein FWF15_10755 [Oscillospiraceae bacterium]|nr:hypothetical protein [Oscillospiraceae bacterium]